MQADIYEGKKGFAMKVEVWNEHEVRFVEQDGQWWAVAQDIAEALALENVRVELSRMPEAYVTKCYISSECYKGKSGQRKGQEVNVLSELGVYRLIMRSNKPEAEAFQDWVFNLIKSMRDALGYEQWKIKTFTESVQNHHLNMDIIKRALQPVDKVPYIKAHTIVNKCVANIVGEPKAIGKDDLKERFPEMMPLRDEILTDTTKLMEVNDRLGLGLSVSEAIYRKYGVVGYPERAIEI